MSEVARTHHSLQCWLNHNKLDYADVVSFFEAIEAPTNILSSDYSISSISSTEAWNTAKESLIHYFNTKESEQIISRVSLYAPKSLNVSKDKVPQGLTIDRGSNKLPYISCQLSGQTSDLIIVAHEISHAIQIVASNGSSMPSLAREVCAFIGELALMKHLKLTKSPFINIVQSSWEQESIIYFGCDKILLKNSINNPKKSYSYRWNYPIARHLALQLFESTSKSDIWELFSSGNNAPQHLRCWIDKVKLKSLSIKNEENDLTKHNTDIYHALGCSIYFDILRRTSESKKTIKEYIHSKKISNIEHYYEEN